MPDNENQNNIHREDINTSNYNPNRPQNNNTEHADTKKVVDTAAKGVAQYFAPGVGGLAYDTAKKTPVVGNAIDETTDKVAEVADQVPGVQKVAKGLNDSGITDVANKAIDVVGQKSLSTGANAAKEAGNVASGAQNVSKAKNGASASKMKDTKEASESMLPNLPIRKNTQFQNMMNYDDEDELEQASDEENASQSLDNNDVSNDTNYEQTPPPSDLPPDSIDNNDADNQNQGKGNTSWQVKQSLLKKSPFLILIGVGALFVFILLFAIFSGGGAGESLESMGYVDTMCNYNDTRVTLMDCYPNSSDGISLATYDLDDFVIRMTYAYTKDGTYDDEAIKALMIAIKTNTLSYGNYNSSDKNVEVRICDLYTGYEEGNELAAFDGLDAVEDDLQSLYDEISNYLYISSSYRSTISNLSSQNILEVDASTLNTFQELALEGNTYSQILNAIYNVYDEENAEEDTVFRETLFLGDSRTRGMQNAGVINSGNTVYGTGLGYNWLVGNGDFTESDTNDTVSGIHGINELMRDQASYNIVIWLGVNDLNNVNLYFEEYQSLATGEWSNHNIYIVSVGPVADDSSSSAINDAITSFNNTMRDLIQASGLSNLIYIDLGYTADSIIEYDDAGVHYSDSDYVAIYDVIMGEIDTNLNADYQLYNLTTYCTYYTLTGNTAYWWPIGSYDATQGNIYGGDPVSVTITSYFGPRVDPVTHELNAGHGAIDISVAEGTPVIATRDGTISYTNTGCSVGDYSCGGNLGNYIKIDHGEGIESLYGHLSELLVDVGDEVRQGQIIGYSGNTGRSTGPHLHFAIKLNSVAVDPLDYVDPENPRPIEQINLNIAGDENDYQNLVCSTLLASGFSENATIGIMANLYHESAYSPINLQNTYENSLGLTDSSYTVAVDNGTYTNFINDSAGYGLAQWTHSSRKERLYNFAQEQNTSIGDFAMQFEYLLYELETYFPDVDKYIQENHTALEIGTYWCDMFEGPGGSEVCRNDGVCPSTHCLNRTQNDIESQNLTYYVQNGCSY